MSDATSMTRKQMQESLVLAGEFARETRAALAAIAPVMTLSAAATKALFDSVAQVEHRLAAIESRLAELESRNGA